jgi:hypothetical protein
VPSSPLETSVLWTLSGIKVLLVEGLVLDFPFSSPVSLSMECLVTLYFSTFTLDGLFSTHHRFSSLQIHLAVSLSSIWIAFKRKKEWGKGIVSRNSTSQSTAEHTHVELFAAFGLSLQVGHHHIKVSDVSSCG